MAGTCDHKKAPANVGMHFLHVGLPPNNVTVTGDRSVNGVVVETWTHADLQTPRPFEVKNGERHQVNVRALFMGPATVTVTVKFNGADQTPPPCTLTQDGFHTSAIGLITRTAP
jgi:hypothetical protein